MIQNRIELLLKLKKYIQANSDCLQEIKELAQRQNGWFTQEFIQLSLNAICENFLDENELIVFASLFSEKNEAFIPKKVGIIMAGNIPLVGFHDFLCVFLSGHDVYIKLSSKDDVLLPHFIKKLIEWDPSLSEHIIIADMLKNLDAYIATGSNTSANYFEYYFAKYPHIIRKNRTSIGILTGKESNEELSALADDIYHYFGLGCRNITKIYVPADYDFIPLLDACRKYDELKNHNKFRNNLDYNLALYILNNQFYMSNESLLLVEDKRLFSAVAVLNFEYYSDKNEVLEYIQHSQEVQAIVGHDFIPFGSAQKPSITDFADGVNTVDFLNSL
jgi:hypothetical protein